MFGDPKNPSIDLTLQKLHGGLDGATTKAELKAALHCNKIHSAAVQRRLYI